MADSLLSQADRDALNAVQYQLHATFGDAIYVFKTAQGTVLSTNPSNSFLFPGAPTNDIEQLVIQSGLITGRILYGKSQDLIPFATTTSEKGSDQLGIRLDDGDVRIKLDATGAAFLDGCERVQFDGKTFDVTTDSRPHGLFNRRTFFTYYLKELN